MKVSTGLLSMVVLLSMCVQLAFADYITLRSYDPTASYGGHSWTNWIASKMTMPSGSYPPFVLKDFAVYISYTGLATTPIDVGIWEDSGGEPGALLYSQPVSDVDPGWNNFDISAYGIQLNGGDSIFVGYSTASYSYPYGDGVAPRWLQRPALGVSYDEDPFYPSFSSNPWEYFTIGGDPADWMITLNAEGLPEPSTVVMLFGGAVCLAGAALRRRVASLRRAAS